MCIQSNNKEIVGIIFSDYKTVQNLFEQTPTKTGLIVVVQLKLNQYDKSIKFDKADIDKSKIEYHPIFPELNYKIYL